MAFVINPSGALRNVGPGADIGEAFGQGINVTLGPVNAFHLAREPIVRDAARLVQELEDLAQQLNSEIQRAAPSDNADPQETGQQEPQQQQAEYS